MGNEEEVGMLPFDEWKYELVDFLESEGYAVVRRGEISLIPFAVREDGVVLCDIVVANWHMSGDGTENHSAIALIKEWAETKMREMYDDDNYN